jgi:hypothetical protein
MSLSTHSNALAQFDLLDKEEKSFREAAEKTDRERARVEESLQQLRAQQKQLGSETRLSNDALGRLTRERAMLQAEKERLQRQLQEERSLLEQCAQQTEQLKAVDIDNKKQFSKEMESCNNALMDLLVQQDDRRLQKVVNSHEAMDLLKKFYSIDEHKEDLDAAINKWMQVNADFLDAKSQHETMQGNVDDLRARALQRNNAQGPVRSLHCLPDDALL